MKCYPVIYTRTKYCDYNKVFHVSPDFVNKDQLINLVHIAAEEADNSRDSAVNIVFSEDNYFVFGTYFYLTQLCKTDMSIEQYCHDEYNRRIGIFCGFAAVKKESGSIPKVSYDDYVKVFKKYIVPIWNDKEILQTSLLPEIYCLNEVPYASSEREPDYVYKNCKLYTAQNADETDAITRWILFKAINESDEVLYCSIISESSRITEKHLNNAVTTQYLIKNIKYREQQYAIEQYNKAQCKKSIFKRIAERIKSPFTRSQKKY